MYSSPYVRRKPAAAYYNVYKFRDRSDEPYRNKKNENGVESEDTVCRSLGRNKDICILPESYLPVKDSLCHESKTVLCSLIAYPIHVTNCGALNLNSRQCFFPAIVLVSVPV